MLGRPPCPSGGLVFVIILDVLEDLVREVQLPVDVAGVRIVGVRADGELLLVLPLEDALALGRVIEPLSSTCWTRALASRSSVSESLESHSTSSSLSRKWWATMAK